MKTSCLRNAFCGCFDTARGCRSTALPTGAPLQQLGMDVQSNKQEKFIELGRRLQSQIRGGRQRRGKSNGDLPHAHFFSRWTVDLGAAGNKLDACPQEARELDVQHGDVPSLHVDGRLRCADAEADRFAWECSMDPACEKKDG